MTKITQKNYEAIKIYRQKEKLFELKGRIQTLEFENTKLKSLLKRALDSVYLERENDNSLGDTIWNQTTKLINEINEVLEKNNG